MNNTHNSKNTYKSKNFVVCSQCGHQLENVLEHVKYVLNGHCEHCESAGIHSVARLRRSS
ncbi:hypothetical protein [Paenibacillus sp. Z6-24]